MRFFKALCAVVIATSFAATVGAESPLEQAAKKERERREKAQAQGEKQGQAEGEAKVYHSEDLLKVHDWDAPTSSDEEAAPAPKSGTKFPDGLNMPQGSTKSVPPAPSGGAPSEVDGKRAAARQKLEASYSKITSVARGFVRDINEYEHCHSSSESSQDRCQELLVSIGRAALYIGAAMEDADEVARTGWLPPGEVRAARAAHGMDDAFWDELVRFTAKYRR